LDEADVILGKGGSDLIYQLSRFDEEKLGGKPSLSLILISQKYLLDMVDQAAMSTFKRANVIRFDRYQASELRDIVAMRASLAFHEGKVQPESIDLIADIAAENGDARFAIELLDKSGMIAEEQEAPQVNAEHVRAAKAFTYSFVTEERIGALDRHRKVILLAIARAMKEDAYVTTGEVEKVYKVVAEEYNEKPRAHTQFWAYIQGIANEGIVQTKVSGDAAGGRTTYISIPDVPTKVLKEMLEKMLSAE
jgi:cell division control protein 6